MKWLPAGLPAWFDQVALALDRRYAQARPTSPVRMATVDNPTELPPAPEWPRTQMLVLDVDGAGTVCPVFSDGAQWRRFDTLGAV